MEGPTSVTAVSHESHETNKSLLIKRWKY